MHACDIHDQSIAAGVDRQNRDVIFHERVADRTSGLEGTTTEGNSAAHFYSAARETGRYNWSDCEKTGIWSS